MEREAKKVFPSKRETPAATPASDAPDPGPLNDRTGAGGGEALPLEGPLGQILAMLEEEGEALVEHLSELRTRLVVFLAALAVASSVGWTLAPRVLAVFERAVGRLVFVAPAEALMARLKIAFAIGITLALPVGLYQAWRFVAPALFPEEKRLARAFVWMGSALFFGGLAFGYWVAYPVSLSFFLQFDTEGLRPAIVVSRHLAFFLGTTLSFGVAFLLPLALLLLVKGGILTAQRLRETRRPALFACVVAAAALTPADVVSLVLMAVPLALLYELTVRLAPRFERKSDLA